MLGIVKSIKYQRPIHYALVFLGVVVLAVGSKLLLDATSSKGWPSVSGKITKSEIRDVQGSGDKKYNYKIVYQYSVNGVSYQSSRVQYGKFGNSKEYVEKIISRYPEGSKIKVFYDVNKPGRSVLIVGENLFVYLLPLFGLLFLSSGIFYLKLGSRRGRQSDKGIKS